MYYLKYLKPTDDSREIQNLKRTIEFAYQHVIQGKYDYEIAISIEQAKSNIRAPGLKDSLLIYFNNDKFDKALMEKIIK